MRRLAPADEEPDRSRGQRVIRETRVQQAACGRQSVAVHHVAWVEALGAGRRECCGDVVGCQRPADHGSACHCVYPVTARRARFGLLGIWGYDLQVRPRVKGKQPVVRSLSRVLTTLAGLDPETLLDVVHRLLQVGDGVDDVVDQHRSPTVSDPARCGQFIAPSIGRARGNAASCGTCMCLAAPSRHRHKCARRGMCATSVRAPVGPGWIETGRERRALMPADLVSASCVWLLPGSAACRAGSARSTCRSREQGGR
jgi:hypothetical protein